MKSPDHSTQRASAVIQDARISTVEETSMTNLRSKSPAALAISLLASSSDAPWRSFSSSSPTAPSFLPATRSWASSGAAHSGRHLPTGDCTHWVGCDLFNGSATNGSLDCPQFGCAAAPDFGVLARYVAPSLMAFLSDG